MTAALKAATGSKVAPPKKTGGDLTALMQDPKVKAQIELALPRHMNSDRLARIALTELRKTPALLKCDQLSFLGAIMQCAQLGLEPGSALGHAYLIPFENRRSGKTECQFIIGYRGMLDIARRSGQIVSIESRIVYEKDTFAVEFGLDGALSHKPALDQDRGKFRLVYAIAKLKDGGYQFEIMSKAEIEKIRANSKAGNSGPWVSHYDEMARKTVIRRLFKYLPMSIEQASAVTLDEKADTLEAAQENIFTDVIDEETGEVIGEETRAIESQQAEVVQPPELSEAQKQSVNDFFEGAE